MSEVAKTNLVLAGDCAEVLKTLADASVDAIVTDPPYGLGNREPTVDELVEFLRGESHVDTGGDFMGKQWQVPSVAVWKECSRVLKPGGHLLAFGGTRTFDLISLGLRAAGFEYRDTLQWLYGQGFPKSLDVSKAIDKEAGQERRVVGTKLGLPGYSLSDGVAGTALSGSVDGSLRDGRKECEVTEPSSEEAQQWSGWGTALKPAWEPILMFRKPLSGTVAANVIEHGTGALNIDGCRVRTDWNEPDRPASWVSSGHSAKPEADKIAAPPGVGIVLHPSGRWPTNAVFTHSASCVVEQKVKSIVPVYDCVPGCPVLALNEQGGVTKTGLLTPEHTRSSEKGWSGPVADDSGGPAARGVFGGDEGYVSRFFPQFQFEASFFYEGKVTKAEATLGGRVENKHPTKKPLALMRWLVRLVCRKGGLVLDPYCGSGSTLVAALEEQMSFIGIELDEESLATARSRIDVRRSRGIQATLY